MAVSAFFAAAALGLGACGTSPVPQLPAMPVATVQSVALAPRPDSAHRIDDLIRALPHPGDADWYDELDAAWEPFLRSDEFLAPAAMLLVSLQDPDPAVRRGAAHVLARIARLAWRNAPPRLPPALIAASRDDDARVREFAVRGLHHLETGATLEAALMAAAQDPSARVRWAAVSALAGWRRSPAVVGRLLDALDDGDPRVAYAAAVGVRRLVDDMPERARAIESDLLARMAGDNVIDRRVAAYQFGLAFAGAPVDPTRLPEWTGLAGSADPAVRRTAAVALDRLLLRQAESGEVDSGLLAAQIRRHQAALLDADRQVRMSGAWSLRSLSRLDSSSLPQLDAARAVEVDQTVRQALDFARAALGGNPPTIETPFHDPERLCLPHRVYAIAGLRPWDDEAELHDRLGEPVRIDGGGSEDDGGGHVVLRYVYPTLEVTIARTSVERIAIASPSVVEAGGLRVGMTRESVLALFGMTQEPEATAARRLAIVGCDRMDETALHLDFDADGRIALIELVGYGP